MLLDSTAFEKIESILRDNGTIDKFEKGNGKITGRMMITLGDIPSDLNAPMPKGTVEFIASFDFYDCTIGVAMEPITQEIYGGLQIVAQKEGAKKPSSDCITFFLDKLSESIEPDGSYAYPIYSFVNNTSDMTIVPAAPKAK